MDSTKAKSNAVSLASAPSSFVSARAAKLSAWARGWVYH